MGKIKAYMALSCVAAYKGRCKEKLRGIPFSKPFSEACEMDIQVRENAACVKAIYDFLPHNMTVYVRIGFEFRYSNLNPNKNFGNITQGSTK